MIHDGGLPYQGDPVSTGLYSRDFWLIASSSIFPSSYVICKKRGLTMAIRTRVSKLIKTINIVQNATWRFVQYDVFEIFPRIE